MRKIVGLMVVLMLCWVGLVWGVQGFPYSVGKSVHPLWQMEYYEIGEADLTADSVIVVFSEPVNAMSFAVDGADAKVLICGHEKIVRKYQTFLSGDRFEWPAVEADSVWIKKSGTGEIFVRIWGWRR